LHTCRQCKHGQCSPSILPGSLSSLG
jgi:hypothetical protein